MKNDCITGSPCGGIKKKWGRIMRLTFLFMVGCMLTVSANTYSQTARLDINLTNRTITEIMEFVEDNSEFVFLYKNEDLDMNKKMDIQLQNASIFEILDAILKEQPVAYDVYERQIILREKDKTVSVSQSVQQQRSVTGVVTDVSGQPLPGVTVVVVGTTTGTVTNSDGEFSLTLPEDAETLQFSFVGMQTQEVPIGNRTTFTVVMEEETIGMDEVIVVGYGTQKKANLTGAVDQVTSEVFENRTVTNLNQGLKGVVPNLNITLMDGRPNQAPSFNIRGTTSIGQGGNALVLIDGVEGDPSLVNPNDIESISVLKDAASASIYGARGAFGVVLITTKNPSGEKTNVTYSANFSLKNPVVLPDYVWDGYTWAKMFNEATYNWEGSYPSKANKTIRFSQEYLEELKYRSENPNEFDKKWEINPANGEYVYYYSTDWYDELYKDFTTSNEHNITVSGSSETTSYMVSGRYLGQKGLFTYNTDDYSMLNFRAKGSIQIFPWLRAENNSQFSDMKYHIPLNVGEGSGIWRNIADEGNPMSPMFNPDGTLTHTSVYQVGDMWYGKNGYDTNKRVFKNTSNLTASFFDEKLNIHGDFTFRITDDNEKRRRVPVPYSKSPDVISYVGTSTNDLRDIWRETKYMASNLYGEYEDTYNEIHYFKIMAGYNYEESLYKKLEAERNGLIFEDAIDLSLALGEDINVDGSYEKWNILGGFSRINYSYKDKYLFEVNGRYDGSSKFPSNERYAFFPSYSAGWRISNEAFWNVPEDLISNLKFRISYGSLGNGNIASYIYQEIFNISQSGDILGGTKPQLTSRPSVLPDGLTWETSTTTNVGIDLAMLSSRLIFVGDMYTRNTTDMFTIGRTLPAVFGATPPKGNYADLKTNGWEVSLTWRDRFNLASKPLSYNVRVTLADNNAEITRYNNPEKNLDDYYEGMIIGEIWGYTNDGFFVDQADIDNHADQSRFKTTNARVIHPGDIKLKDINDDGKIDPGTNRVDNPGDRKIIGNSSPRYTYSINLGADWNSFFFSAFFQGVGKQDWYPSREASVFWGQYNRPYNPLPRWHLDNHWTPENPDAYLPRYVGRLANRSDAILRDNPQTKYLQNIAYIRLKNIQLGYNLPLNLISKIGAENAKIYISGENIWTWSPLYKRTRDIDVENTGPSDLKLSSGGSGDGYNYPMLKSLSFGLSVTF
ncbi:TonB-linked outer membrane protein, SusC/RagA family [Tangfeifania diversioriginum]|uniref:TonB-linked outer membrane protein, SusC/RagA family n=1 Tax=Tangfeifania diversioriginum TaxID=1168035 RepID=A0A1M6BYN6_9BACT|nr:TonB-dependent receptor [Tangfeifania diversioriginum]SHI53753.1 TonB-linked outer membrane protein, SusC/RagA family [Tangfeifania diversioriginum]